MLENKKPLYTIKDKKAVKGEFTFSFDYIENDESSIIELNKEATESLFNLLKEKVNKEIPTLLQPSNFFGEAEEYMRLKGIPFKKSIQKQFATAIYNDFISNLDKALKYDTTDGLIYLSPYIYTLEYGDFYRPAVKFLSTCIKEWLVDFEKATRAK